MRAFRQARIKLIGDLENDRVESLNEETHESVDDLIVINMLGMLTVDSQQGRIERGRVPDNRKLHALLWKKLNERHWELSPDKSYSQVLEELDRRYKRRGGTYHKGITVKEKAYLVGFLPVAKADELVEKLGQLDHLVAWKVRGGQEGGGGTVSWVTYVPTTQDGQYSKDDHYPLTGFTHVNTFPYGFSQSVYGKHVKARKSDNDQFALVSVQDTRFGHSATREDGLFCKCDQSAQKVNERAVNKCFRHFLFPQIEFDASYFCIFWEKWLWQGFPGLGASRDVASGQAIAVCLVGRPTQGLHNCRGQHRLRTRLR